MKALFAPAFALVRRFSVYTSLSLIIALLVLAQLGALGLALRGPGSPAAGGWTAAVVIVFLLAIYLLLALAVLNKKGMEHFSRVVERIASGDLSEGTRRRNLLESESSEAGRMWRALGRMGTNLVQIVRQVRASAERIGAHARTIAADYVNLSNRTEQQASTLEETASSMEQLSATVKQNADACRKANACANDTGKRTEEVGHSMELVTITMERIESGSKKMSEIIGLIEGIAFQTNILALNAAVEAARAGEQGRGFSVVAAEVRSLAQRSAQAAEEIKGLITTTTRDIGEGATLVTEAQQAVNHAVAGMREVLQAIESIASASEEQSVGMQEISRAITELENVTQHNAQMVHQGAEVATAFESEANRLIDAVGAFALDTAERARATDTAGVPAPAPVSERPRLAASG